jgi:hypothetical protein
MKQPKQQQERSVDLAAVAGRDTRPLKPPAGETVHHRHAIRPLFAPTKGRHARSQDGPRGAEGPNRPKEPFEPVSGPPESSGGGRTNGGTNRPDQQPLGGGHAGGARERYVRLRMRVRGDRLSVVDSHLVDGPLGQSTSFQGTNAYEVTYQDRLLHAGTIPDLGMQRSFPNPEGPPDQRGHHLAPREVFEFSARVPAHEVTAETIGGIRVALHQVQEPTSAPRLAATPLADQFEGRMQPVAELVGLPESALPERIEARGGTTATGSADQGAD